MSGVANRCPVLLQGLALLATIPALCGFTTTTLDPAQAQIVTTDVEHFWRAFDDAAKTPLPQRPAVYAAEYLDLGSQGLKDFTARRIGNARRFSEHVEENRAYYAKVRPQIGVVVAQKQAIEAAFRQLKAVYPDIKFPKHVYFVIGRQHAAGINSDNGIILAAEMFATPPGTPYNYGAVYPDFVPFAVVHETVHFNQAFQDEENITLLQGTITEGTADFIASLALPEPDVRQYTDRWQYGCAHEAGLAARYQHDQDVTMMQPWMYDHAPAPGWPPDMGYWMGYRIDQSLYAQAQDKTAALRSMLQVTDFKALFKKSGYPAKATACKPQSPR
ncbi:MAG TPA: DUF2268 domain-containing putative Zn-dependent protease [Steroidobacteraceae bacterium]|jgi:hypothetical protein|nr:DUF2268 domain-containing putative Zn-dependent protease [Steroidobacteraceae bacterium]